MAVGTVHVLDIAVNAACAVADAFGDVDDVADAVAVAAVISGCVGETQDKLGVIIA